MSTKQVENVNRPMPDTWPTIYGDEHGTGAALRQWLFRDWCENYNNFGSLDRSHGWTVGLTSPGAHFGRDEDLSGVEHCLPTMMQGHLGCEHNWWDVRDHGLEPCQCVGGTAFRGACLFCDWESPNTASEAEAIELANDHAWPGWRDLPIVRRPPTDDGGKKAKEARHKWAVEINALLPTGWLEQGGPVRVKREPDRRLHMPLATGFGGYEMGVRAREEDD